MTPSTLQALRRLLFFSRPEAAALVGRVTERSWRFWETGERPIPADVIDRIHGLIAWRETAIRTASETLNDWKASLPTDAETAPPALVWYDTIEDWMSLPDREPAWWRPQCSVVAEMCARFDAVAVPFDGPAYAVWLGKRHDSESLRGQWAASTKA